MESEATEKCPQCSGRGQGFAVMCGPKAPGTDDMKCTTGIQACDFCGGLGLVEVQVAERYRRGQALRDVRVRKRMLTQAQMAHWLRISPMLLNDIEHGRTDWPAYVDRQRIKDMYED
jgi:hypothetical protein